MALPFEASDTALEELYCGSFKSSRGKQNDELVKALIPLITGICAMGGFILAVPTFVYSEYYIV